LQRATNLEEKEEKVEDNTTENVETKKPCKELGGSWKDYSNKTLSYAFLFVVLYSSSNDLPLHDSKKNLVTCRLFYFKTKERKSEKCDPACEVAAAMWPASKRSPS